MLASVNDRYDVAVVGLGLFGSAAVRHLARSGVSVIGVGPGEPAAPAGHEGVFASHYDSGRITRRIDGDPLWSELADRSIVEYPAIADQSGIDFHSPVGLLWVEGDGTRIAAVEEVAEQRGIPVTTGAFAGRRTTWPFMDFPDEMWSLFEDAPAGHIDPRRLREAQLAAATRAGATLVDDVVVERTSIGTGHRLRAARGAVLEAATVVVAAGAYTGNHPALPRPVPLRVKTETIVLAELDDLEAERLRTMPSVIYGLEHPIVEDVYVVPPVRYPDGSWYVKIGANTDADRDLAGDDEVNLWMRSGNTDRQAAALEAVLRGMLPNAAWRSFTPKRCIISYTPHGRPCVDHMGDGVYVAAGGNGMGAKSSDAIGALAARLVTTGAWADDLPASWFAVPAAD
jgi:sarcosine oxidase